MTVHSKLPDSFENPWHQMPAGREFRRQGIFHSNIFTHAQGNVADTVYNSSDIRPYVETGCFSMPKAYQGLQGSMNWVEWYVQHPN
jgi:hypothetical protein